MLLPLGGLLLVVSDRLTELPQRRWSPAVAAFGVAALAGGTTLLARAALSESNEPTVRLVAGAAAGLIAFATVYVAWRAVRTAASARDGESTGLSLLGWLLFFTPAFALGGVVVFVAAAALTAVAVVARQRDVVRGRLLSVLSTLVELDRPLTESVDAMAAAGLAKFKMRKRLILLGGHLRAGLPLVDALAASKLLRVDQVEPLRAAAACGTLAEGLRTASEPRRGQRLGAASTRLEESAQYLYAVALALVAVIGFVGYFIVPKFREIFWDLGSVSDFDGELGPVLEALGSGAVRGLFSTLCGAAAVVLLAAAYALRVGPAGLPTWMLAALPRRAAGPHVLKVLSVPAAAGRPMEPIARGAGLAATTTYWRTLWGDLSSRLSSGEPVAEALLAERLLSRRESGAVAGAARSGSGRMLGRAADVVASRHRRFVAAAGHAAAGAVMLLLAAAVGAFSVAMFDPLCRLIRGLS